MNFIGVVHAREIVRLVVVKLFSVVIPYSSDFVIVNRIMPAIVTLSNDSDLYVLSFSFHFMRILFDIFVEL